MASKPKRAATLAHDLAALADHDVEDLRQLWKELLGYEPLPRISRELLIRAIAWRLQENTGGGVPRKILRKLERLTAGFASCGAISLDAGPQIRAGTRLVREWQGRVYEVIALDDDCYLWKGARYRSLSEIARAITGARWSGPRFFGTGAAKKTSLAPPRAMPEGRGASRAGAHHG